jgi:nucleoside-diphosphate-sugar epimerase
VEKIIVTGSCGFIGFNYIKSLDENHEIIGIDSLNNAYDPKLKELRLEQLRKISNFKFLKIDLSQQSEIEKNKKYLEGAKTIVHLGARAGVRQSYLEPEKYIRDNTSATVNLALTAKNLGIKNIILASTSSIYGDTGNNQATENKDELSEPPSIYAATKGFGETLIKSVFSEESELLKIGRFFTVYGPYGRPDMSILRFVHWIATNEEVIIYGDGQQRRSFTYVMDIVDGLNRLKQYNKSDTFNFGSNTTWSLIEIVNKIENYLGKKANLVFKERAFRDVDVVLPNLNNSKDKLDWEPLTNIDEGLKKTIDWYKNNESYLEKIKFKYDYEK